MRSVGIKTLKNKLSEYVRLAARGETVLVVDRDKVVAELVPPSAARAPVIADAVLANLVREGLMTPALVGPGEPPARNPCMKLADILADLGASRADR